MCPVNVAKVWETLGDRRGEVVEKVLQCQTAEELLELAATYGVELTDSQAEKLLDAVQARARELSESELEAVTGGQEKGDMCTNCFKFTLVPSPKGEGWFHCSNPECKDYRKDIYHPNREPWWM